MNIGEAWKFLILLASKHALTIAEYDIVLEKHFQGEALSS